MVLPLIQYAIMLGISLNTPPAPPVVEDGPRFLDELINRYRTGTYPEILFNNVGGLIFGRYPDLFFTGRFFRVLGMFLIGLYISKNMIFDVAANRPLIRKTMIWGAIIGIPCNIALAMIMTTDAYESLEPMGIIQPLAYAFGVPALALCYASAFALIYTRKGRDSALHVFAPVGQLALTNYLMQSVICVFIFMSYGLGLEATIGPAYLSLIAFAIYIFQVIFSHIWIRHYRFGPAEWLWRSLTYRQRQPFRKTEAALQP